MKTIGSFLVKLAVFLGVYFCWRMVADHPSALWPAVAVVWGGIALAPLAGALWLQSLRALVWVAGWFSPAWILYVRLYEERELEVRFGAPCLD